MVAGLEISSLLELRAGGASREVKGTACRGWGRPWHSTTALLLQQSSSKASMVAETAPQPWVISEYNPLLKATFTVSLRCESVSKALRMLINVIIPFNIGRHGYRLL